MCDEDTVADNNNFLEQNDGLTRRKFNALAAGAAVSFMLPRVANAQTVQAREVSITTPDGIADCYFVHPVTGKHPAVIVWPDILGRRDAYHRMGQRLAESGYSVLVVNPYYRSARAPVVPAGASFQNEATRNTVYPLARSLSPETNVTDAKAFVSWLDEQKAVDQARQMGTTGYCMGGAMTMRTCAAIPERLGAGASFHGGRLVTDGKDSPHLLVSTMDAEFLFAIAENDDEKDAEAKVVLAKVFASANLAAEIEVYKGAMHGWCALDSAVYNEALAEKAWARLLVLFNRALA